MNLPVPGVPGAETREQTLERLLRFARKHEKTDLNTIWSKIYHNAEEHSSSLICKTCEWLEEVDAVLSVSS